MKPHPQITPWIGTSHLLFIYNLYILFFIFRPAILSHDHCYWSSGATKETDTGRGATPTVTPTSDQRRCVLCSTVGDTDSEVSVCVCDDPLPYYGYST